MKTIKSLPLILLVFVLSDQSHARVTTVSGGATSSYKFYDRTYEYDGEDESSSTDDDSEDYSRLVVSPTITIVSEGVKDALKFSYAPGLVIELDEGDNDINHDLLLNYDRALTSRWNLTLSNSFVHTDEFQSQEPVIDSETGQITSALPGDDAVTGNRLDDTEGRRSYFTNTVSLGTNYTYAEDSDLSFDYAWTVLRNDDDDFASGSSSQDYDKHDFGAGINHRINTNWRVSGDLGYSRGLYDSSVSDSVSRADDLESGLTDVESQLAELEAQTAALDDQIEELETQIVELATESEDPEEVEDQIDALENQSSVLKDQKTALESQISALNSESEVITSELTELETDSDNLEEYDASLTVSYDFNPQHSMYTSYSYYQTDYEAEVRRDSEIHDITLGWEWNISPRLNFSLGGGPTYSKIEGESGSWDPNGNFALRYQLERGSVNVSASGGVDTDNFSGTSERSIREYWQVQTGFTYSIFERVTVTGYATFLNEDSDEAGAVAVDGDDSYSTPTVTINTRSYGTGVRLTYLLDQDWSATLSYDYTKEDSDILADEYDAHAVTVGLSYQADFFRW